MISALFSDYIIFNHVLINTSNYITTSKYD